MQELELLRSIRPQWLTRAVQTLARGTVVREDLRLMLERFYDLLEQVIETGDPAWLDSIISLWSQSMTQSDLENATSNLSSFIGELSKVSYEICRQSLSETQALELLGTLLPIYSYAFEKAAVYEIQARIQYVSNRLEEMQQSLEKLDRSKSDFIAVAAHELKTPLTLVEGYASMLRESLEKSTPDSPNLALLAGVLNGTARLHGIIDDMIDVSLIDNNLLLLNFQPLWINRLFSVLQNEVQSTINERQQKLDILPFPGSAEMTFGDPERLLQVFRNVLTNAVKYTPDGGSISVYGRKLPGFIEVTVCDTGIGIDQDNQIAIFDKFGRLGNSSLHSSGKTKFKGGGPGLGLHIAKGIVEAHGGAIWVESPGFDEFSCPGSAFHILIPLRLEPPDAKMARLFAPLIQSKS